MKPKIRIIARERKDNKKAKLMQELIDYEWEKYKGVIGAIGNARTYLISVYGLKTPDSIWDNILEEIVRIDINKI